MDDHLNNYHLVDEDPRMILAKNLGESGSCTSAINILIHILTAMGASDDFIKSMTDCGTVLSKEINHDDCLDIEDSTECTEPAYARVFLMIGDLMLKNEEMEKELYKIRDGTNNEDHLSDDTYNSLHVMFAIAYECLYHAQIIILSLKDTEFDVDMRGKILLDRGEMLLDLATTYSRIGDILRYRKKLNEAIESYHQSIDLRLSVTGKRRKLLAMDQYHLSLCYEELYEQQEEGRNCLIQGEDKSSAHLLVHSIGFSLESLLSLAMYVAGDNDDFKKKIEDIGEKAMKNDDHSVKRFSIGFDEVHAQMKEFDHNNSNEEFGIIGHFVQWNLVMRARRMITLFLERGPKRENEKSANSVVT